VPRVIEKTQTSITFDASSVRDAVEFDRARRHAVEVLGSNLLRAQDAFFDDGQRVHRLLVFRCWHATVPPILTSDRQPLFRPRAL
jgi:hypothetical protein